MTEEQPASGEVESATPTEVGPGTTPPEVMRALFVASLKSWAVAEEKITRPLAEHYQTRPGLTPYRASSGEELGHIQRQNPDPEWTVTDGAKLREHLMADPENVETSEELDPPNPEALIELVREHRPEWLQKITYLRDGVIQEALAQSRKAGKPAAPGIELYTPVGKLVVKANPGAREVFARMIRDGEMNFDGTTPEVEHVRKRPALVAPLPQLGTRITTRMKDQADDAFDRGDDWWDQEPEDPFAAVPHDPFAGIEIQK